MNAAITQANKCAVNERILTASKLMALGRLKLTKNCETLVVAFRNAVWDSKNMEKRLDDGTSDIDNLDNFEYSRSTYIDLLNAAKWA